MTEARAEREKKGVTNKNQLLQGKEWIGPATLTTSVIT